jgi:subtilisin family serine protease
MPALGMAGFRISVPSKADSAKMLARLKLVDPKGIATFNHVYEPARGGATLSSATSVAMAPAAKRTQARIGLVDARVNASHPMLRNVRVSSKTFGIASSSDEEHGTAVASRIAEAAPGANLVVASVFSELSNGQEMASVDAIARALNWLSVNNVPVINLSLAGPPNPVLEAITAKLISKGHVLVAAVGNEGPHASPQYPAAYSNVVGVTAVDSENKIYLYANQGDYVDFAAPGVNTRVAANDSDLETVSGTSYAAPVVAAALARRLKQPDPYLAKQAERELAKSAQDAGEPGRDPVYGFGIVSGIEK